MKNLICPYAEGTPNCAVYDLYLKNGKEKQEDIISKNDCGDYSCRALEDLLKDLTPERITKYFKKRISGYRSLGCSHIELLNNTKK